MTIAITAVSGNLGADIAKALIACGSETVVGLARTPERVPDLGIEIRPGDYAARAQLETTLAGVSSLVLVSGNGDPKERIGLHRNVIDAARTAGVSRIVYTSIQGAESGTAFSPVVQSNRQTEADIRNSGLDWIIGRNGIYIEPDVEYIESYRQAGEIANCADEGRCGYTTRAELAAAYANLLSESAHSPHNSKTYNFHGTPLTQAELTAYLNRAFGAGLNYRSMSVEAYRTDRITELGDFMGTIITGIYEGIRNGALDNPSHFETAAGRPHQSWDDYFRTVV